MDGMYAGFAGAKTGHGHMALCGCFLFLIRCHFAAAFAPPGRGHPHSVFAVRRKDTVESGQIDSGFGHQGSQCGRTYDVSSAIYLSGAFSYFLYMSSVSMESRSTKPST